MRTDATPPRPIPRPARLSVAFCPGPPVLHPAAEGRASEETTALRDACLAAVRAALDPPPTAVVVVGPADPPTADAAPAAAPAGAPRRYGPGDGSDLRRFGLDVVLPFAGPTRPDSRRTPISLGLGGWLLDAAGYTGERIGVAPADLAAVLAAVLAAPSDPVAVLALGDGSARRTVKAPGYLDPAAEPFDAAVAAALAAGDAAALADLDPDEGERLLAAGVPVWRAVGTALAGRQVTGRLLHDAAPLGVGYLVAHWVAHGTAG